MPVYHWLTELQPTFGLKRSSLPLGADASSGAAGRVLRPLPAQLMQHWAALEDAAIPVSLGSQVQGHADPYRLDPADASKVGWDTSR